MKNEIKLTLVLAYIESCTHTPTFLESASQKTLRLPSDFPHNHNSPCTPLFIFYNFSQTKGAGLSYRGAKQRRWAPFIDELVIEKDVSFAYIVIVSTAPRESV